MTQHGRLGDGVFPLPVLRGGANNLYQKSSGETAHAPSAAHDEGGEKVGPLGVFVGFVEEKDGVGGAVSEWGEWVFED